jgi:vitamin B12/bleomycin/antimicrobial peptide transport system ATP-binding/permease protein
MNPCNAAERDLMSALTEKRANDFYAAVARFALIVVLAVPLFAFNIFFEERLIIAWRVWLTQELCKGYFSNQTYYNLKTLTAGVDNPDQRE